MKTSQFIWPFINEHSGFPSIYCEQFCKTISVHVLLYTCWKTSHMVYGISICPSEPLSPPLVLTSMDCTSEFPFLSGFLLAIWPVGSIIRKAGWVKSKARSEHLSSWLPSCWMSVNGQDSPPWGSPRLLPLGVWIWWYSFLCPCRPKGSNEVSPNSPLLLPYYCFLKFPLTLFICL